MIRRARLFFFAALLIAVVVLVANFPSARLSKGGRRSGPTVPSSWRCKRRTGRFRHKCGHCTIRRRSVGSRMRSTA